VEEWLIIVTEAIKTTSTKDTIQKVMAKKDIWKLNIFFSE
jgi:hypothetical protein